MENKHTPGPWEALMVDIFGDPAPYMEILPVSRVMFGHETSLSIATMNCMEAPEQQANAHLIAAAPDLLEALEELFDIGDVFNSAIEAKNPCAPFEEWAVKACAAIAKARGTKEHQE